MLENSVQEFPHNTALIFEGYQVSYTELFFMLKKFASFLSLIGVKKGDVVAIICCPPGM
ncbi:MAG: AMP-binding protein [Spirochaetota bacterium]